MERRRHFAVHRCMMHPTITTSAMDDNISTLDRIYGEAITEFVRDRKNEARKARLMDAIGR